MDRDDRAGIAGFFVTGPLAAGTRVVLDAGAAQHARVRRLQAGREVRLVDGLGHAGFGQLVEVGKHSMVVAVDRVVDIARPSRLDVVVPIADRDRMLLAAEKCVELQATGWRPAYFARSRSVTPRGEGEKFREKVRARMRSALEQSGGAWLPEVHEESEWSAAADAVPKEWMRVLLDARGVPLPTFVTDQPVALAAGPEGGLDSQELSGATDRGWRLASLGHTTLRFETALIAAVSIIRASQPSARD